MDKLKLIEAQQIKDKKITDFNVGDTVRVLVKIPEADKIRIHPFEGTVIAKKSSGLQGSFTVRRVSFGEGIEKTFHLYSPVIEKLEVIKKGKVRRAKLYYLRGKIGKAARIESE